MTTIVLYENALCTDRLNAVFSNETGFKQKKLAVSMYGSTVIAVGGKTRSQKELSDLADAYELLMLLDLSGKRESRPFEKANFLIRKLLRTDTLFIMFVKDERVHMRTLKGSASYEGVFGNYGEVYGTGGKPALVEMMRQRKREEIDHESIMKFAAKVDSMTSTEYDIVYAASLTSIEDAYNEFVKPKQGEKDV